MTPDVSASEKKFRDRFVARRIAVHGWAISRNGLASGCNTSVSTTGCKRTAADGSKPGANALRLMGGDGDFLRRGTAYQLCRIGWMTSPCTSVNRKSRPA